MQVYLNFIDELVELVNAASAEKKKNVAIDICNKLFPHYQNYSTDKVDVLLLNEAIDYCKLSNVETAKLDDYLSRVVDLMPESMEMMTWEESYASNAVEVVIEFLQYRKDNSNQHIVDICSLMIDNIDFQLAEKNEDISDDEIFAHPEMLGEMKRIKEMLK